jgi:outer membrane protein TolC
VVEAVSVGRLPVSAEAPDLPEEPSLADYLAYAEENNPGLRAALEGWRAALEKMPQVTSLPDPRLTYRYFIDQVETRVGPQRQSVSLAQMFPWFGKLALRGAMALEGARAAWRQYEGEKLRLHFQVKDAYYEYYYLARAIDVVRSNRDLMKYLEEVVRARYRAGAAEYSDVIRAQVELGKLEDRLRALRDLRGALVARLNAALNRPIRAPLPWPKAVEREAVDADDGQILEWFRQASPELKALSHEVIRRRHAIDLARKDFYPDVTLGLTYIDTENALGSGTPDSGKDPIIAMVSINLPIWREKYRAGEREARARHRAARVKLAERENSLSSRIKMTLYRFRDAERKIGLYRDTLVPKARQSLKATETAFRAGRASFLDLVDAERVLLDFQLSGERALADYGQRLGELEMLVGRGLSSRGSRPPTEQGADAAGEREPEQP